MMLEPTYGSDDSLDHELRVVGGIARKVGSTQMIRVTGSSGV
jgi:hypothetical protein